MALVSRKDNLLWKGHRFDTGEPLAPQPTGLTREKLVSGLCVIDDGSPTAPKRRKAKTGA